MRQFPLVYFVTHRMVLNQLEEQPLWKRRTELEPRNGETYVSRNFHVLNSLLIRDLRTLSHRD
jgi:hypothetical protein